MTTGRINQVTIVGGGIKIIKFFPPLSQSTLKGRGKGGGKKKIAVYEGLPPVVCGRFGTRPRRVPSEDFRGLLVAPRGRTAHSTGR